MIKLNILKTYIQTWSPLSEESWRVFCDCLTERNIKKGQKLLKEGEICNSIFFVIDGICKASYNLDGKEINTAFYFENDFATNIISLVSGVKSEFEIKACTDIKVIAIHKIRLLSAYKMSQEIETFGRKILEFIVSKQELHLNSFKLMTPKERYQYLKLTQPQFLQRVSLTQTASYLGISRETLSRYRRV